MKPTTVFNWPYLFFIWKILLGLYFLYYQVISLHHAQLYYGSFFIFFIASKLIFSAGVILKDGKTLSFSCLGLVVISSIELMINREVISPEISMMNAVLLAIALWQWSSARKPLPQDLLFFCSLAIAVVHFTSGFTKLISPDINWRNGDALYNILTTSSWRNIGFADSLVKYLPRWVLTVFSLCSLALELLGPLVLFRRFRLPWLVAAIIMHTGALFALNLAQVSVGVVLCLLFVLIFCQVDTHEQ